MSLKLYEIPEELARIEALLIETGGELTPDLEAALAYLQEAGAEKVEAAWAVVKNLQAFEEAAKAEAARLTERAKSAENAAARLKAALLPAVQALGNRVKGARWTIYAQTRENTIFALKPGAEIFELPPEFVRTHDPELNKTALKDAAKAGKALPEQIVASTSSTTFLVGK